MCRASIESFMVQQFRSGVRAAWTALESGESADGLRDRLTTLERQLKDITPTLETRGHREMLRDLTTEINRADEGSGVHELPAAAEDANTGSALTPYTDAELSGSDPCESAAEAHGLKAVEVEERRYDLGYGADAFADADTCVALDQNASKWFYRAGLPGTIDDWTIQVCSRYMRATDEDGIECWVRREP